MTYLQLFYEFLKIGLFAVGGGPATIPFLSDLAASSYGWFNSAQLADMIAIAESTPGPIGVNMATYAGYNAGFGEMGLFGGVLGGVIATMGLVLPSLIIIMIIANFLAKFSKNKTVRAAFYGLRPAVMALIASAVIGIMQIALFTGGDGKFEVQISLLVMTIVLFVLMQIRKFKKLHPAFWLAIGAVMGIVLGYL